ncbi:MAG: glycosyltransferase family 1 protein [Fibrobacteria bacterium]
MKNLGYKQPGRMLKTVYRELIWAHTGARVQLHRQAPDILHSPAGPFLTPPPGVRQVVTLLDFAILAHPERYRAWQRWSGPKRLLKAGSADRIICISRFSADEAMKRLGIPHGKIDVIYLGSDLKPGMISAGLIDGLRLPDEFVLFVGSLEPGKNLRLLKETYKLAASKGIILPTLVIMGTRWQGVPDEGPPPANWIFLGRQPDEILVHLYARASALLFPSKYEGFGLPVLEAMGFGCPVICSPVASIPEVGGDAVLYSPLTAEGYLDQILRLGRERNLREELQAKGRERAKLFSWDRCGRETYETYQKALR